MAQTIEIQNDLVSIVERNVTLQVPLSEWLPKIERRAPIHTPTLPHGTRAMIWDPTNLTAQHLIVLVEREPQIINMNLVGRIRRLSIPWTYWIFVATTDNPTNSAQWRLNDYRLFWSKTSYTDARAANMVPALIPNVYSDGRICFGSTGANADQPMSSRIDQTVNEFYLSTFNHDLTIRYPNNWTSFTPWVTMTNNDPMSWTTWRDLDPTQTQRNLFSFEETVHQLTSHTMSRSDYVATADPIPPLQIGATFGHLNEWVAALTPLQHVRLATIFSRTPTPIVPDPQPTPEDEEE